MISLIKGLGRYDRLWMCVEWATDCYRILSVREYSEGGRAGVRIGISLTEFSFIITP